MVNTSTESLDYLSENVKYKEIGLYESTLVRSVLNYPLLHQV